MLAEQSLLHAMRRPCMKYFCNCGQSVSQISLQFDNRHAWFGSR